MRVGAIEWMAWMAWMAAVSVGACRTPTQITLAITTDVRCGDRPSTAISVGGVDSLEDRPLTSTSVGCTDSGRVGALVVIPSGARDAEVGIRVVMGIGKTPDACVASKYAGGCIVARRALRFLAHEELTVAIPMRISCKDVPCGATTTCVAGRCVPATIQDPSKCKGGGCDEGALQPSADAGPPDVEADVADAPVVPVGLIPPMSVARSFFTTAMLPDGRVLVAAGGEGTARESETWRLGDPSWTKVGDLTVAHARHETVKLSDGTIVILGGLGAVGDPIGDIEVFDPKANAWSAKGAMGVTRLDFQAASLGMKIFAASGLTGASSAPTTTAEILLLGGVPQPTAKLPAARKQGTATTLLDGRVLVAGGYEPSIGTALDTAVVYEPSLDNWTPTKVMNLAHQGHGAVLLDDGRVVVASDVAPEVYDPKTNAWTILPGFGENIGYGVAMVKVGPSRAVVMGGGDDIVKLDSVYLIDVAAAKVTKLPKMAGKRQHHGAVAIAIASRIVITGGQDGPASDLSTAEVIAIPP